MVGGPLDGAGDTQTPTEAMAGRRDVYLIAAKAIREVGLIAEATAEDVLELTRYLAGEDF
jgi:hypothetical protein